MPIYEYQCHQCGHKFDALQKISDSALTECPNCGKNTLDKVISATQFQLKGTGWYATDFKKNANAEKKSTPSADTSSTSAKTEPKTPSSDSQ